MRKFPEIALAINLFVLVFLLPAEASAAENPSMTMDGGLLRLEHPGKVSAVAFSPDGGVLATGGADKKIRIWPISRPERTRTLTGHQEDVLCFAFSPDGTYLASGGLDKSLRVFDVHKGKAVRAFGNHEGGVWAVAFSPDGKLLASGGADLTLRIWDSRSGRLLVHAASGTKGRVRLERDPDGHFYHKQDALRPDGTVGRVPLQGISSLAFSPDGKVIACSEDVSQWVGFWDVAAGSGRMKLMAYLPLECLAYSPDGKALVLAQKRSDRLYAWSPVTNNSLFETKLPKSDVRSLRYSADGRTLAAVAGTRKDCTIYFLDAASAKVLRKFDCPTGYVTAIDLSPDGKYLAAASVDREVLIWNLQQGGNVQRGDVQVGDEGVQ